MPMHTDFEKMKAEMIKKHGDKKGEEVFWAFMKKNHLDETKSMGSQKGKMGVKETEIENFDLKINTQFTTEIITEGENKWCKVGGVALEVGKSRNKINYREVNLTENDGREVKFFVEHEGDSGLPLRVENVVGKVKFFKEGSQLKFDGKIRNTQRHPDIVEKAKDGLIDVSIDARTQKIERVYEGDEFSHYDVEGTEIRGLCAVGVGGVPGNKIEYAIAERFKEFDELNQIAIKEVEVTKLSENNELKEKENRIAELELKLKESEERRAKDAIASKVKGILSVNKDLKEEELMKKSLVELEIIEEYEKKFAQSRSEKTEGHGRVEVTREVEQSSGVVRNNRGDITLSESAREKFYNEIKEKYW